MLGAIIGDIVGSTREWHNVKQEDFELLPSGSRFTDDSVMTLAVAQWLMEDASHRPDTLVAIMQELGRRYPDAGYGGKFRQWLRMDNPLPYGSFGNGSAMRVSPVGLYASSLDEALELAKITASVSHDHPEGIKGAQATAACVYMMKHEGYGAQSKIKNYIEKTFGYDLSIRLEDIRATYAFDSTCQGSVPIAIMAFLQRANALDTLRLAISMGGDSDTIGCIATSIACARSLTHPAATDLPQELIDQCRALLTPDLRDIYDRFVACLLAESMPQPTPQEALQALRSHFAQMPKSSHRTTPDTKKQESFIARYVESIAKGELSPKEWVRDCIRGSLMAGAAGDALGYPVEFMSRGQILSKYGRGGITQFELDHHGKALVSDDTQMTLFTANGILMGCTQMSMRGIGSGPEYYVDGAYLDWYYTQIGIKFANPDSRHTWLRDLPELAHRRAPGTTCMGALDSLARGKEPQNNSKGCGGIMRVAPMGLFAATLSANTDQQSYTPLQIAEAGAYIARVTHKHPLGYLPAALMALLVSRLVPLTTTEAKASFIPIVNDCLETMMQIEGNEHEADKHFLKELTLSALRLAQSDTADAQAIAQLGEGWTADEAWAISIYCAMRHLDSTKEAIIAAVNHDGDSDSTGSITGNIMGAIYGYQAIRQEHLFCPNQKELEDILELSNLILTLSDDLTTGCIISEYSPIDTPEKQQWYQRYCQMLPAVK